MPLVASFQVRETTPPSTLNRLISSQIADGLAGSCGGVLRGQGTFPFATCIDGNSSAYRTSTSGRTIQPGRLLRPGSSSRYHSCIPLANEPRTARPVDRYVVIKGFACYQRYNCEAGQVVALFIVGLGEYGAVWLGTDWEKEIMKGIERNREEAKHRLIHNIDGLQN